MNLFKRCLVFVTFFGSCVAVALLVASLGTKQWVVARARRTTNPAESDGIIHFGLFDGRKELNVAYGWRTYDIDVLELLRYEPELMIYGLWLGTTACVVAGLLFSTLCAIFAAVNTATTTSGCLSNTRGLYVWNTFSLLFNLGAICFWLAQFHLRLTRNVLSYEDRQNMWSSDGRAELGFSFWFVVGAAVTNFVDLVIVYAANSERENTNPVVPMLEEKASGAIMLY